MDKLIVEGPNQLSGEVSISGAKNAALPILASTLLTSGWSEISNIPFLGDIRTMIKLLSFMGVQVKGKGNRVSTNSSNISRFEAPYELVKTMRASALVLGPLLARFGQARVSLPGGCAIGQRPINLHLDALKKLGAHIEVKKGYVVAHTKELKGATIYFEDVTVTGTENIMMAATLAKGVTVLKNAAKEPEIIDLANILIQMGAKIWNAGTDTIKIEGVSELQGTNYSVMSDRIEAGTILLAVAATGGNVKIKNCDPTCLDQVLDKLRSSGVQIENNDHSIWVKSDGNIDALRIETQPYPGFPTDLQAQMMAFLTQAKGTSTIVENIFENRFNHVAELQRMGADITIDGRVATIKGRKRLSAAPLMATDLRASASLVIAGLVAEGKTEISRVYHLDRGYESLEKKLQKLGANIVRVSSRKRGQNRIEAPRLPAV